VNVYTAQRTEVGSYTGRSLVRILDCPILTLREPLLIKGLRMLPRPVFFEVNLRLNAMLALLRAKTIETKNVVAQITDGVHIYLFNT